MPGLGKSGTFLMAAWISATAGVSWVMELVLGRQVLGPGSFHLLDHLAQFLQSNVLNLPHPFARDTEFLTHFLQRFLRPAIQAEPGPQNRRFPRIQGLYHLLQHSG